MLEWVHDNATYFLSIAAALAFLAACWLGLRTGRKGSAGLIVDIGFPFLLAGLTIYFLPDLMVAVGVPSPRYRLAIEGLFFRSLWLGLLLDQTSWVQRTTQGLRGRRASLPILVWAWGFVILILSPLTARGQNAFLAWLDQSLDGPDMPHVNADEVAYLLTDWGLRVAQCGISLILVGAFALAMQATLWIVRIIHAYAFTQSVEWDDNTLPPYAPGCFQSFFGFAFGVAGVVWLVWATVSVLRSS